MHGKSKKHSKTGLIALILSTSLLLSGCGTILAGTQVDLGATPSIASQQGSVVWFDGYQKQEAVVTVSKPVSIDRLPFDPDLSKIPLTESTNLRCFQIQSSSDISSLYDMQALDENDQTIIYVNVVYDGAIYPLGKNWYGVIMPNGYDKPYHIRIGNTSFTVN